LSEAKEQWTTEPWLGLMAFCGIVLGLWAGGAFERHERFVWPGLGIDTAVDDSRNIQEAINAAQLDGTNTVTLEPRVYVIKRPVALKSVSLIGSGATMVVDYHGDVFSDTSLGDNWSISHLNLYFPRDPEKEGLQ
jgi:hypothetical protein